MLAAFTYWGFQSAVNPWIQWPLGLGVPLLVACLWGVFLAPRAARRLHSTAGNVASLVFFGLGALALFRTGQTLLAATFAAFAFVNRLLVSRFDQW
jgi:Protein of unknown function (DUF2568)